MKCLNLIVTANNRDNRKVFSETTQYLTLNPIPCGGRSQNLVSGFRPRRRLIFEM